MFLENNRRLFIVLVGDVMFEFGQIEFIASGIDALQDLQLFIAELSQLAGQLNRFRKGFFQNCVSSVQLLESGFCEDPHLRLFKTSMLLQVANLQLDSPMAEDYGQTTSMNKDHPTAFRKVCFLSQIYEAQHSLGGIDGVDK